MLHFRAQAVSGQPNPSYAYPIALREGLAFVVLAAALLIARLADARAAMWCVWIWFAVLSVLTAMFLPGISPYFLFPTLLAALAAIVVVAGLGEWAFAVPMLAAAVIWIGLVAAGEGLMGLMMHPLFTVPAAFAAMTMIPLADARAMGRGAWLACIVVALGASLVATVIAGLQPAFSRTVAQRLSIRYVENAATKQAVWALDAGAPLPAPLRGAADFSKLPESVLPGVSAPSYNAPAGAMQFAPPRADVVSDAVVEGHRRLTVALHGSDHAGAMFLYISKEARLVSVDIHGQHLVAPKETQTGTVLACASHDCASEVLTLEFASRAALALQFGEQRYGLPPRGAKLVAARPKSAIPSQNGDVTVLLNTLQVAAK
jgi:hypothetical protein